MFEFYWNSRLHGDGGGGFESDLVYFKQTNKYIESKKSKHNTKDNEQLFNIIKDEGEYIGNGKYLFKVG